MDVLRLIDAFRGIGLYVGSRRDHAVRRSGGCGRLQKASDRARHAGLYATTPSQAIRAMFRSSFPTRATDATSTSRPPARSLSSPRPAPARGKMATCLSQLYHEHKRGVTAGYAKFETFPIWNLPLKHPVNLAYEAATADLNDVNMIDPFHLEAYGVTTVNYNRDVEIFPVVARHLRADRRRNAPISPRPTWASTWRATASSTTMPAARPPARRSSAATIRRSAMSAWVSATRAACASSSC